MVHISKRPRQYGGESVIKVKPKEIIFGVMRGTTDTGEVVDVIGIANWLITEQTKGFTWTMRVRTSPMYESAYELVQILEGGIA